MAATACGQSDGSSSSAEPTSAGSVAGVAPSDGPVTSVEQLADGFWQPVRSDGVAIDPTEGDYWQFLTRDGQLVVTGFDGCNGFGSSSSPDDPPTAIEDGRLSSVRIATDAMACDGIEYGPYPEDGDLLTLTNDGSRLELADETGIRIELVRLDQIPTRRLGETPTSGASGTAPPITDLPITDPSARDGTTEPTESMVPLLPTEIVETTVPRSRKRSTAGTSMVGRRIAAPNCSRSWTPRAAGPHCSTATATFGSCSAFGRMKTVGWSNRRSVASTPDPTSATTGNTQQGVAQASSPVRTLRM